MMRPNFLGDNKFCPEKLSLLRQNYAKNLFLTNIKLLGKAKIDGLSLADCKFALCIQFFKSLVLFMLVCHGYHIFKLYHLVSGFIWLSVAFFFSWLYWFISYVFPLFLYGVGLRMYKKTAVTFSAIASSLTVLSVK